MHETPEDVAELERQLEVSYASAGEHLRSILTADRRASARDVAAWLNGVFMISLATVTAKGEPIVAPIDGLFFRGRLWFSLPPGSLRARHLRARPQVSATYAEAETGACLIVHGAAVRVDATHPLFEGFDRYARSVYGIAVDIAQEQNVTRDGEDFTGYIEPRSIYAHGFPRTSEARGVRA